MLSHKKRQNVVRGKISKRKTKKKVKKKKRKPREKITTIKKPLLPHNVMPLISTHTYIHIHVYIYVYRYILAYCLYLYTYISLYSPFFSTWKMNE